MRTGGTRSVGMSRDCGGSFTARSGFAGPGGSRKSEESLVMKRQFGETGLRAAQPERGRTSRPTMNSVRKNKQPALKLTLVSGGSQGHRRQDRRRYGSLPGR